jgi:copper chaperone CopZ
VEVITKSPSQEELHDKTSVLLSVRGMGCESCANRVRNSLTGVYGVVGAEIDLAMGTAQVVFNPGLANVGDLKRAVERAGKDGRHTYRALRIA